MSPPAKGPAKVIYVLYDDLKSKRPKHYESTWEEFSDLLVNYSEESPCSIEGPDIVDGKRVERCAGSDCPHKSHSSIANNPMAWSPVEIVGTRADANVRSISVLALDFDHLTFEQRSSVEMMLEGYTYALYTTHNHRGDEDPSEQYPTGKSDHSFRVAIPLTRKVLASEWHRFRRAAIAYLDLSVDTEKVDKRGKPIFQPDPQCKDRSRIYYRQSYPRGAQHDAYVREGEPVDVEDVLGWGRENMAALDDGASESSATDVPAEAKWDLESEPVKDAIDLIANYLPPTRRHELALAISGMLRRAGATVDDAYYILREGYRLGGSKDPDARADTVYHTYELDDGSWMTGYTRAQEIMGEDEAYELGECLGDAKNAAILERLRAKSGGSGGSGSTGGTGGTGGTSGAPPSSSPSSSPPSTPPPAPKTLSIDELKREIKAVATKKAKSTEWEDGRTAQLIRRLVAGEPLAKPGGFGDIYTQAPWTPGRGVGRQEAIKRVFGPLAFALPDEVTWEALEVVSRASLWPMAEKSDENWLDVARKVFERARRAKAAEAAEREAAAEAQRTRVREVEEQPELRQPGNWQDMLMKGPQGSIMSNTWNVRAILENHPDFFGHLRWNEVTKKVAITGPYASRAKFGVEVFVRWFQDHLTLEHGISINSTEAIGGRIEDIARTSPFDPIRDYLTSLKWDGVPRIEDWLFTYLGANSDDNPNKAAYIKQVGRKWLIATVARGLKPGCKVDNVLVLCGDGGLGKSAVFAVLGGEWFSDSLISIGDKDSRMFASENWICELAECAAIKRASNDVAKNFYSSQIDKIRPPYGRHFESFPRRCVFVGTANEDDVLTDDTGNRKYWPVNVTKVDIEELRRDRDQLFAEAVAMYKSGATWYFTYSEIKIINTIIEESKTTTVSDVWVDKILLWWYSKDPQSRPSELTVQHVATEVGQVAMGSVSKSMVTSIGSALKRAGFLRCRARRVWVPTEALAKAPKRASATLFVVK